MTEISVRSVLRSAALRRAAVALFCLPAIALAQDVKPVDPTGVMLLEALPPAADLVIHTPSLPRFLASAPDAGFGDAAAWSEAFRGQLRRWGAKVGDSERLIAVGEQLLATADGECVLAAMSVPAYGAPPRERGALMAFRSRAKSQDLRALVDELIAAGLRIRFTESRADVVATHPVTVISSDFDSLWISIDDGLVLIADHPHALALYYRGLDRVTRGGELPAVDRARRLEVRWGRNENRWTGFTYFQRESASWTSSEPAATAVFSSEGSAAGDVLALALSPARDVPLFATRLPDTLAASSAAATTTATRVQLLEDGSFTLLPADAPTDASTPAAGPVCGTASSAGWLRALRHGGLTLPVRGIDRELLDGPLASVTALQTSARHAWKPGSTPGELRGPAWNGPATMMALRVLDDIRQGLAPGAAVPEAQPLPTRPTAPLPPPPTRAPAPEPPPAPTPAPGPSEPPK